MTTLILWLCEIVFLGEEKLSENVVPGRGGR
jgi:hypothetical protein